jgi:hypothetical protein
MGALSAILNLDLIKRHRSFAKERLAPISPVSFIYLNQRIIALQPVIEALTFRPENVRSLRYGIAAMAAAIGVLSYLGKTHGRRSHTSC